MKIQWINRWNICWYIPLFECALGSLASEATCIFISSLELGLNYVLGNANPCNNTTIENADQCTLTQVAIMICQELPWISSSLCSIYAQLPVVYSICRAARNCGRTWPDPASTVDHQPTVFRFYHDSEPYCTRRQKCRASL